MFSLYWKHEKKNKFSPSVVSKSNRRELIGYTQKSGTSAMRKIAILVIFTFLSLPPAYAAWDGQTNQIAIASEGNTIDSSVGDRAARCKCFLIFDEEGQLAEVLDNPHRNALFDAGPEVVDLLAEKGVTLLVARRMGARMIEALKNEEIARLEYTGTVADALERASEEREKK
jgi:predicted Fe-Mo cluster-binding NifX family protein